MKTINGVLLLVTICFFTTSNAQFLKKLKDRAKEATEQTVERKVAEKTQRETDKTFDTVFNNKGKLFKGKKAERLDQYSFSHEDFNHHFNSTFLI